MWNKSCGSGHPCLLPDFSCKPFSFSPLSAVLPVGLSEMTFMMLCYVPAIQTTVGIFIMNGCWVLLNGFSPSLEMMMWVLTFLLLMWCVLFDLHILNHSCEFGMNPTWLWCMIFIICFWIWLAKILLRIFAPLFIKDIGL